MTTTLSLDKDADGAKVNQIDIARKAGVSVSTVSRVLSASPGVGASTRSRVLSIARAAGYLPDAQAPSRAPVLVFCPSHYLQGVSSYYYQGFLRGIRTELDSTGQAIELCIFPEDDDAVRDRIVAPVLEQNQDSSCILLGEPAAALLDRLSKSDRHTVLLNVEGGPDRGADRFVPDNFAGGRAAADCLYELGHRSFCYFYFPSRSRTLLARRAGFFDRLKELGISEAQCDSIELGANDPSVAEAKLRDYVAQHSELPTGLFCLNDLIALGVYSALIQAGYQVPRDASIIGFDDFPHASIIGPGLTTLHVPCDEMGRAAARQVLDRMDDPDLHEKTVIFRPKLIQRGSVAAPRAGR
ncbi:LacI family DNA-binding transcriptional regulator [Devosia sp. LjRoot16]|jgi:LacI family transcriptional regulator|uniref:LacI family DNA-binding transcriptional regulator n=1 Tax=Devosia sp. LjRoot16 TaxID=3342271 RepID=UPI003ECDEB4D